MDSLRLCIKISELRKALATLPRTLDETYERILTAVDEGHKDDVLKVLQWLCFSKWPVLLDEMVEVIATDVDTKPYFRSEQRLPEPRDILTICSGLVAITAAPESRGGAFSRKLGSHTSL